MLEIREGQCHLCHSSQPSRQGSRDPAVWSYSQGTGPVCFFGKGFAEIR